MNPLYQWMLRGGVVVAALAALLVLLSATGSRATVSENARAPIPTVRVAKVLVAENAGIFRFPSRIRSTEQTPIGFTVDGRIVERTVRNGETVAAGQLLARIDEENYRLSLQNAAALVTQAEVEQAQLVRDMERARQLGPAVTAEENEQRATAVAAAEARLTAARARARAAERALEDTRLTSPFDAVVTGIHADVGSVATPGNPVVSLSSRTRWVEAEVRLPFMFVRDLHVGAQVLVVAPDGIEVEGRLAAVAAHSDSRTGLFPVTVVIENPPTRLVSGVSVDLVLPAAVPPGTVLVPTAAVASTRGGEPLVVVVRDGVVHRVPVAAVGATQDGVLVSGAIASGEDVVIGGRFGLEDGDQVEARR